MKIINFLNLFISFIIAIKYDIVLKIIYAIFNTFHYAPNIFLGVIVEVSILYILISFVFKLIQSYFASFISKHIGNIFDKSFDIENVQMLSSIFRKNYSSQYSLLSKSEKLNIMHSIHIKSLSDSYDTLYFELEKIIAKDKFTNFFIKKIISLAIHAKDYESAKKYLIKYKNYISNYDFNEYIDYIQYLELELLNKNHEYKGIHNIYGALSLNSNIKELLKHWNYNNNRSILHLAADMNVLDEMISSINESYEKSIYILKSESYTNDKMYHINICLNESCTHELKHIMNKFNNEDKIKKINTKISVENPSWYCNSCKSASDNWYLTCNSCLDINTIIWQFNPNKKIASILSQESMWSA